MFWLPHPKHPEDKDEEEEDEQDDKEEEEEGDVDDDDDDEDKDEDEDLTVENTYSPNECATRLLYFLHFIHLFNQSK